MVMQPHVACGNNEGGVGGVLMGGTRCCSKAFSAKAESYERGFHEAVCRCLNCKQGKFIKFFFLVYLFEHWLLPYISKPKKSKNMKKKKSCLNVKDRFPL